jgi:ABC-2 type transport system permease protein
MMMVLDVAAKDLLRSARSVFILVFALVLPLLTAGVFYAAFGGLSAGDEGIAIGPARVLVVNRDPQGEAGMMLEGLLTGEDFASVLEAERLSDPQAARTAVDAGEAAAAVIIPEGFSIALESGRSAAAVEVYQDPAGTVGPAIVRSIVEQLLDGFAGMQVALRTSGEALASRSLTLDAQGAAQIADWYAQWVPAAMSGASVESGVEIRSAAGVRQESMDTITRMVSVIMAMMMVFYCFFTGTAAAQSILKEQEEGTLPRMFTTPVRRWNILAGKMLAVFITLLLQLVVLLTASAAMFGIRWGDAPSVLMGILGTGLLSASFAVFLTSFLKDTKQAGTVYGVVVNLVGWIGISRLFAGIMPGLEKFSIYTDIVSLVSPQGWAALIWQEALAGDPVWATLAGMIVISLVLFGICVYKFNRRFSV